MRVLVRKYARDFCGVVTARFEIPAFFVDSYRNKRSLRYVSSTGPYSWMEHVGRSRKGPEPAIGIG